MSPINEAAHVPAPLAGTVRDELRQDLKQIEHLGSPLLARVLLPLLDYTARTDAALQGYRAHEGRLDDQRTDVDNLRGVVADLFEAHTALLKRVEKLESRTALVADWQGC